MCYWLAIQSGGAAQNNGRGGAGGWKRRVEMEL